jgi:hypothetical protein
VEGLATPEREMMMPTVKELKTLGHQHLSEVFTSQKKYKMGKNKKLKKKMLYWTSWHITREALGTSGLKEGVVGAVGQQSPRESVKFFF